MSRRKDPVTPELREFVLRRDKQCVALTLGFWHICRDAWGTPHRSDDLSKLTLDHVQEGYGMLGRRAPSDPAHLVSLCWETHLLGWATANRQAEREYLRSVNEGKAAA